MWDKIKIAGGMGTSASANIHARKHYKNLLTLSQW